MSGSQEVNFSPVADTSRDRIRSSDKNILRDLPMGSQGSPLNELETLPQFLTLQQVLISSILYHAQDAILSITLGTIYNPFDRVATLLTVEGELKRQHVLPMKTGFGGIRQCWRQLWTREGLLGCMRSSICTPLLRFPSRFLVDLFSHAFCRYLMSRYTIDPSVVMAIAMVSSVMLIAPYNIWQRVIRTMYRADLKTMMVSSSDALESKELLTSSCEESPESTKKSEPSLFRRFLFGRSDMQYHFPHLRSTAVQLGQRLRNWKLVTSSILLEVVYKNTFTWGYPILLFAIPTIGNSLVGRAACLVIRDVTIQPFRVVMGRLAVSATFSSADSSLSNAEKQIPGTEVWDKDEAEVPNEKDELPRPPMYRSAWDCVVTIVRVDGVRGLWAGLRYRILLTSMAWVNSIVVPTVAEDNY